MITWSVFTSSVEAASVVASLLAFLLPLQLISMKENNDKNKIDSLMFIMIFIC